MSRDTGFTLRIDSEKVTRIRSTIMNGKAPSYFDKFPGEILKYAAPLFKTSDIDRALCILWKFITDNPGSTPLYWLDSVLTLLYKNSGCVGNFDNYRCIAGSSIHGKLYEKMWTKEATDYLCNPRNPILNKNQGGFWPGKWCPMLQIAALGSIALILKGNHASGSPFHQTRYLTHHWRLEYGWNDSGMTPPLYQATAGWKSTTKSKPRTIKRHAFGFYLDMRKAFDSTCQDTLIDELRRFGFDAKSTLTLRDIFHKIRLRVKANGLVCIREFLPQKGFSQGRPASPICWNILYDNVLDTINKWPLCLGGTVSIEKA